MAPHVQVSETASSSGDDWETLLSYGYFSPLPTLLLSATYVFIVKVWGPWFMRHREPLNIKTFLVWYNAAQVVLSTYIFVQVFIYY